MTKPSNAETLQRIQSAIDAARVVFSRFTAGAIETEYKIGHDPVTEADRALDAVLRKELLREGEGWLSEESVDDYTRLGKDRVWVVDPLDGTREFVAGIPEFCVSIAMVENGRPVAGGICNPATNEVFLGSLETGVTYNGKPAQPSQRTTLTERRCWLAGARRSAGSGSNLRARISRFAPWGRLPTSWHWSRPDSSTLPSPWFRKTNGMLPPELHW